MKCALTILWIILFPLATFTMDPQKILASMSIEQKIAQLIIAATISNEEKNQETIQVWKEWSPDTRLDQAYAEHLIKNRHIGGVIFYGNNTSAQEQKQIITHLQSLSPLPLFFVLDTETGLHNRLSKETVTSYPCAMALGAIQDCSLLYQLGVMLGNQLKALGVNFACSPVCDINWAPNPIIGARSFGENKYNVAKHAIALMQGLQKSGIIACAKHWPGHGRVDKDSHEELPLVSSSLRYILTHDLYPFKKLIDGGVKSVMLAHLEIPALEKQKGLPSSLSHAIATTLLKKKLGFKGIVITDAMCMKGVTGYAKPGKRELMALQAGADLILCPEQPEVVIAYIAKAMHKGKISEKEINRKGLKVLKAKAEMIGQKDQTKLSLEDLQSEEAKKLKQQLFAKSITLAKSNKKNPFWLANGNQAVITIGDDASPFEEVVTKHAMPCHAISQTFDDQERAKLQPFIENNKHIIISIHTMNWDQKENYGIPARCFELLEHLKKAGKEVTVVVFGSPYSIPQFKNADNILVAYQNDEGAQKAAAEIICGVQQAEGKLPIQIINEEL